MRVHELAKDLGISSQECRERLEGLGIVAKSHMSTVESEAVAQLTGNAASSPVTGNVTSSPVTVESAPPPAKETAKPGQESRAKKPPAETSPPEETAVDEPADTAPVAVAESPPDSDDAGEEDEASTSPETKVIRIKGAIIVKELAAKFGLPPNKLIAEMMAMNVFASITERVDISVARKIAERHGYKLDHERRTAEHRPLISKRDTEEAEEDRPENLLPRSPVVTFLGHVDHGKTSLLDRIRDSAVVKDESGGITQHIGAYTVDTNGKRITFLDTPGHAAFTAMRARGANLTDIAVIIIAADDGIMPQTREAIQHAQAANVSLLIALNKIDLPSANVDRVKQQLQGEGLAPEDWGGETICCSVSAETGEGIDHLLEMILLQAEVLELTSNSSRRASGFVIESSLEPGTGPTANVLVTRGSLKVGDFVLCEHHCGKTKALINDHGANVKTAGPSTPVKMLGLSGVPSAGAKFLVYANEKAARAIAQEESTILKQEQLSAPEKVSLENLFEQIEGEKKVDLRIVLKADTQGSIEAIRHTLDEIKSEKIAITFILSGTGSITENDVMLASASNAIVQGFHVGQEPGVDATARHEGVQIRLHSVIYELADEVKEAMTGMLSPEFHESIVGIAEIRQVFSSGKTGKVAGCMVTSGSITPKHKVRVRRGEDVLFEGGIESLKHFQDSVAEVRASQECGIRIEKFTDFDEGDILEFIQIEEVQRTL
jgi:translation initiation factor IF-2